MSENSISRVENITRALAELHIAQNGMNIDRPSKNQAKEFTDLCFNILFPINARKSRCCSEDESSLFHLDNMLTMLLLPVKNDLPCKPDEICKNFISQLPKLFYKLMKDARAICNFDPASSSLDEVIITYPGFFAITAYRIAHALKKLGAPLIPRLISEYAHSATGIDINPGAEIGESFFIDHGTGVVIGETCIIKNNVKIYQGVTLGALQVKKELAAVKRHPTVEDNVIIYSNATILGGKTVIGSDSIIGGNVWITSSVPSGSLVYHTNQIRIKPQNTDVYIPDYQI